MNGIDEYEYRGEGYMRQVNGAKWTLAALNYAERFDEKNIVDLERHNLTDETFVLLEGEATLLTCGAAGRTAERSETAEGRGNVCGAPRAAVADADSPVSGAPRAAVAVERVPMVPLRYYNVRAGIWHNIIVKPGTRCLVAENADTSKDNTDYLEIATGRVFKKRPTFEEVLPGTYLLKVPFGPVWTGVVLIRGAAAERTAERSETPEGGGTVSGAPSPRQFNVLIDSSHLDPEPYLIPALADLGLKLSDIDWLLNTHVHGDHIGGHHALVTKYGLKTCTLDTAADALRDPVKVAIRVRTRFPKNSPAPQSYLKGVEPNKLLKEWNPSWGRDGNVSGAPRADEYLLEGRFAVLATPGHDDDCLTWIDTVTGTAFTGDSLQANGTPTQGIGFYRDLPAYRRTLAKLKALISPRGEQPSEARQPKAAETGVCRREGAPETGERRREGAAETFMARLAPQTGTEVAAETFVARLAPRIENIVCGHFYDGIGDVIKGRDAVAQALAYCEDRVALYGERLRHFVSGVGEGADATGGVGCVGEGADATDESALVPLALKLIGEVGCGMPESLFLALHTVSEHLKEIGQ